MLIKYFTSYVGLFMDAKQTYSPYFSTAFESNTSYPALLIVFIFVIQYVVSLET